MNDLRSPRPETRPLNLAAVNGADHPGFMAMLGGTVEHSPWVAELVAGQRPFGSVWQLHRAMCQAMQQASTEQQLALMRQHPELAGREAAAGTMTASSTDEQGRLGLLSLSAEDHQRLAQLNAAYQNRFGFPFIAALRLLPDLAALFSTFEQRLARDADTERQQNLQEIGEVLRGRLSRLFDLPMGWLSTHVLDSVQGGPASGMVFDIAVLSAGSWQPLGQGMTNKQGRTDLPVLVDDQMSRSVFQFEFHVGDYYRRGGVALSEQPFLDRVPLRFGVDDPDLHYHVPLLCTPWAYSTYRGS